MLVKGAPDVISKYIIINILIEILLMFVLQGHITIKSSWVQVMFGTDQALAINTVGWGLNQGIQRGFEDNVFDNIAKCWQFGIGDNALAVWLL